MKKALLLIFYIAISLNFGFAVNAQGQDFNFSGNDPESYNCIDASGKIINGTVTYDEVQGKMVCSNGTAVLKPPKLNQLEIWFVRVIYVIWALVASLSFFMLVGLGFQYMITRGDVTKITEIRKRILYYILGFVLIFLAIPILTTLFNVIGINEDYDCYNVEMPGFQFFFTESCN